jgi:tetratricopeptide (TPR) repeat protein
MTEPRQDQRSTAPDRRRGLDTLKPVRRLASLLGLALLLGACTPVSPKTGSSVDTALALMFHNRYAAAAAQFQQLIRDRPSDARPHAAYALLLNYELKQADALKEATAASDLAPQDGYALTILTRVQDWNNQVDAAAQTGGVAVKIAPHSSLAHSFYGEALADVKNYTEAQAELKAAASFATTAYEKAEVERNWSNFYRDQRDYPRALTHLKLAASAQPDWIERLLELAHFSIDRNDLSAALTYLQRATLLAPDDPTTQEQLGEVAIFKQDFAIAKTAYQTALRLQPNNALDLQALAEIAVALDHDFKTAESDARAALAADPTDAEAGSFLVALLRYLENDPTAAAQVATTTVVPKAGTSAASQFVNLDQLANAHQDEAIAAVNRVRRIAGLAPITASAVIHQSALSHAYYTFWNAASPALLDLGIHREATGGLGYTGDNVLTRAQHFGYPAHSMTEDITHRESPSAAVTDWIDSVFHRIPILRADLLEAGYGDASLNLAPLAVQVLDMAYRPAARNPGLIVVYPAPDQTDVPAAFFGNEIPDPAPNAAYPIGYPITATFDRSASVSIQTWQLSTSTGQPVAGIHLLPDNPEMENSFGFLANTPLAALTQYTMALSGTINGVPFQKSWRFTTAGLQAPQTLTA